ncbi:uncharacterized protein LOC134246178 [Saccostrea cucullata]|uniref:uncharacterized protein LOC134246178 n=1 Tax=Saccostrea cuccullata TaxID=36930 RepID=UPI002ED20935
MDNSGNTTKDSSFNTTTYTSIAPYTTDYFVSAESYQKTVVNEPRILHSLVSSEDKTEQVSDFEEKCERLTDVELQGLIQRTRTHIVPRLIKTKNISELSRLLLRNNASVHEQFSRFIGQLFLQKKPDKKWSEVQHHVLAEITLRGIGAFLCHSKGEKDDVLKVAEIGWRRMSGHKSFLPLPQELSSHLFSGDKHLVNSIIQCLNISEGSLLEFTETYIQSHVTDLVFHHTKREILPKKSDHSYWSICPGRINKCDASIAILVPGISMSSLQVTKKECKIKNDMLENDFKILLGLQNGETHINVVRLLAYSVLKNSLPFYVKENHRTEILEKLLEIRGQKTKFPVLWLNNRLIEMLTAINYLHGKKIIHRDVTLRCFHLARFSETEEDAAVLYDLNLACQTDFSMTASCDQVAGKMTDMQGDGIPIRWSAVESILLDCYDARSDIWMFGHVIHELFTYGCEPFTDHYSSTTDDIISGVLSGDISPHRWPCIPYDYHKLAISCWRTDPKDRPSAEELLKELRRLRDKRAVANEETSDPPHLSERQKERGHEPERGISPFIRKLKEKSLEKKENIRETVIEIRRQSMSHPTIPVNKRASVLCPEDLKTLHNSLVEDAGEYLRIEEQVTVEFCEKILPAMSPDFSEKMGIIANTLSREKKNMTGQGIANVLTYKYPKAVNILELLKGNVSQHSCAKMLLAVAQLVQRMHAKRWVMVALTAKNIYIQQQENQYRAFLIKLGTMVRLPESPDINQGSVHVSHRFEDMIFWIPREVIAFGELSAGSDVYTMAMLFYQVYMAFSGHGELQTVPFGRNYKSEILGVLNEGQKPEKPEKCPGWLYDDVMIPCWHSDRSCRPSICDIVGIMSERISENQGIAASSLKTDKRSLNNENDTSQETITKEQNLDGGYLDAGDTDKQQRLGYYMLGQTTENQYDDIMNTNSNSSRRNFESSTRSFTLNDKEMAQFDVIGHHPFSVLSSSSFVSPMTNTNLGFPNVRVTDPRPFQDRSRAFGVTNTDPESNNTKSNPLFDSFLSGDGFSASLSTNTTTASLSTNTTTASLSTNTSTANLSTNTATASLSTNTATTSLSTNTAIASLSTNTATASLSPNTATASLSTNTTTASLSTNTTTTSLSTNTTTARLSTNTATASLSTNTATASLSTNTATASLSTNTTTASLSTNTTTASLSMNTTRKEELEKGIPSSMVLTDTISDSVNKSSDFTSSQS